MHFRFWFGHTLIGSTHLPLRFRGGSAFLDLQQATLEADGDGFGAVGSVEFGEDRFDVGLGGVFGNGGPRPLPDFIAGNLFLLAQEALANALKHSGARHVTLCVVFSADAVELSVRDDGHGFEPGSAVGVKQGHFGLQGMRERIKRLGRALRVESAPGAGTQVLVQVPVPQVVNLSSANTEVQVIIRTNYRRLEVGHVQPRERDFGGGYVSTGTDSREATACR